MYAYVHNPPHFEYLWILSLIPFSHLSYNFYLLRTETVNR
jgi:hypothetical protein